MTRDWRKVALAVLVASALAAVCLETQQVEARQATKSKAKSSSAGRNSPDPGDASKKKRQDPAEAQRAVEDAAKLLQSGKAEQAEQTVSATLSAGSLPPAIMARALYVRGMAYRQQKKPAQAISDLTSALWLKGGLTAEDRADAMKQRTAAYADAGLTETGAVATATPTPRTDEGAGGERPPAKTWGTVTTPAGESSLGTDQASQGNSNWFQNWFNAWTLPGTKASNRASTAASVGNGDVRAAPAPETAQVARVSSSWSSMTKVSPAARPDSGRKSESGGKYRVQLATVRTQREAAALAAKAKRALGELAQEPEIDQTVLGNMGSFYRVRVGPFTTAQDAQAVCAKVRGTDFDCLTVTQ